MTTPAEHVALTCNEITAIIDGFEPIIDKGMSADVMVRQTIAADFTSDQLIDLYALCLAIATVRGGRDEVYLSRHLGAAFAIFTEVNKSPEENEKVTA